MDPYRSYYPDQFLEETSDLLNLDPSQLADDDDLDSSSFANSAPPPPATPYGLEAYFAAAGPVPAPAPTYNVNGNLPSYASEANGSVYSSADGNTAPPSSWADIFSPTPAQPSLSAQSTPLDPNSPAMGYLTPELLQMLLPVGHPLQSDNLASGSDPYPPGSYNGRQINQAGIMSAADFEASQASRSMANGDTVDRNDGNRPQTPLSGGLPISSGENAPNPTLLSADPAYGYWPQSPDYTIPAQALPGQSAPPPSPPTYDGYGSAVGNLPLSDTYPPDWSTGNAYDQRPSFAPDLRPAALPWNTSSAALPYDFGDPRPPSASGSGGPPLKIVNINGRQMMATATGFAPLDDLLPLPAPGASVPVDLDLLHERIRGLAQRNQDAAQQSQRSLAALLPGADHPGAQNPPVHLGAAGSSTPQETNNAPLRSHPFLPDRPREAAWGQRADGQIVLNPARPADALRQLNAAGLLSNAEYWRRLPEAQTQQTAAIARALRPSPAALADPFGRDPLFAPAPPSPSAWAPLPPREIAPDEPPLQVEAGQLFMDATRYPQALKTALAHHLISQQDYDHAIRGAYLVQSAALEDRQLRQTAGPNGGMKALAGGLGKGAVSLGAGAAVGAGVTALAPESAFTSLALVPGAAITAGEAAGGLYESLLPDSWQAAVKLHPTLYGGGELAPLVLSAPLGLAKTYKAARLLQETKGAAAVAKFLVKPAAAGAIGTAIDQASNKLVDPDDSHFNLKDIATGALLAPLLGGLGQDLNNYTGDQLAEIWTRGTQAQAIGLEPAKILNPAEHEVFDAMIEKYNEAIARGNIAHPAEDGEAPQIVPRNTPNHPPRPTGKYYSVAYQMKLKFFDFGRSRSLHARRANAAFHAALLADPQLQLQMEQMIPGVTAFVSSKGGRATPPDWRWHHHQGTGIMQLVPLDQHTNGSIFWSTLHPNGRGGYSIWAIPAGAPLNK